jgi:hypothetical protein
VPPKDEIWRSTSPIFAIRVGGYQQWAVLSRIAAAGKQQAKETIMKRTIIRAMFTVTLATALAVGLAPTAQAADKGCSNATLTSTLS